MLFKHCVLYFLVFYHKVEKYARINSMTFDEAKVNIIRRGIENKLLKTRKTFKDHERYEKQTHKVTDNRPSNGKETNTPFTNDTKSNHQIHPKQTF